ncbi:MAG: carboxypeptidase regulatory-like domain-containing protein [Acidobacteria bacterium]|nr:carboxypeptidase regulatory-like domain-containing protein [Acidobacteriota bacterium]
MRRKRSQRLLAVVALGLAIAPKIPCLNAENRSGTIAGQVTDGRGIGQAGVPVNLLHQDGRFARKVYTQNNGRFRVEGLLPGVYGIEVLLPTFLPFWKTPIRVQSGAEVLMEINLRSLAESMELRWPANPAAAREEWGWTLRSGSPPRPLLRFQESPDDRFPDAGASQERPVHGAVQFWAGNEPQGFGRIPGLHTTFGMEYEESSDNKIEVAGSAGWERNTPAASFHTAWTRQSVEGTNSTLSATVRQLFLPPEYWRSASIVSSPADGRAQSVTVSLENEKVFGPKFLLRYGTLLDTVNIGQKTSRWSPFGRITYSPSNDRRLVIEFTTASPRMLPSDGALTPQINEQRLAIPQLSSDADSRPVLEGGSHVEASWEQEWDSGVRLQAAAFYDSLSAVAFALGGTEINQWMAGLPDPFTNLYYLSGGNFSGEGVRVAVSSKIGSNSEVIVGYSYASGLRGTADNLFAQNSHDLREQIQPQYGHSLTVQLQTTIPGIQTQLLTAYRWVPRNTIVAPDLYNRGFGDSNPYLNIILLQPIPSPEILPGHFQALADFSNFLGQGYLPVDLPNGERGFLVPASRSFRGGFNFIF